METVKLSQFIENPDNPQTVTDEAFDDLVESVRRDPETLAANKIAYCTDYVSPISNTSFVGQRVVMAGNKRLRALKTIHGPEADVNADYFFDLTPLGVEARRRWLVRSNVQTGEWEMETLMKLYSKDELQTMMSPDALGEILETLEAPEPTEGKTDPDEIPAVDETEAPASKRGGGVRPWQSSPHVRRFHGRCGRPAPDARREGRHGFYRSSVERRVRIERAEGEPTRV